MKRSSESPSSAPELVGELRDSERIIRLWRDKASLFGGPPPASAFDFSRMTNGDWGYRFLINADVVDGDHAFLVCGSQLARLLELPQTPALGAPFARHLPRRYRHLFTEGCSEAIARAEPVRMSGAVAQDYGVVELYRAAFLPLAAVPNAATQLIFGTFNRRLGPKVWAADTFRQIHSWVGEDIRSEDGLSAL
jgi:hypothetical protein